MSRLLAAVRARHESGDAGFSLIELLVVITILPLIMGALAAAFIIAVDSQKTTANKLSDSIDAQLTAAYFVRDVQGAGYVTTDANAANTGPANIGYAPGFKSDGTGITFFANAPQICGPSSVMTAHGVVPAGYQLLVALFHPPTSGGSALSAGYWLVGTSSPYQIVRYSCTVTLTNNNIDAVTSSKSVAAVMADNVNPPTPVTSYLATVQPTQFQTAAASTWAATVAETVVQDASPSNICSGATAGTCTVTVTTSTVEFAGNTVEVVSPLGSRPIPCTVASTTTFTCTISAGGQPVARGYTLSQDSIQNVDIAVRQTPANPQTVAGAVENGYRLAAAPRTQAAWGTGPGTSPIGPNPGQPPQGCNSATCLGPTLLVDGSGGVSTGGNSSVTVTGTTFVDGSMNCSNNTTFTSSGGTYTVGTSSGCGTTNTTSFFQDPLASLLPACFPRQGTVGTLRSLGNSTFEYTPGRYTQSIPPTNTHGTFYFDPGVYELDGGLSVTGGNNQQLITIAPGNNGQGVLLFIPGPTPVNPVAGCAYSDSNPTFSLGAQGSATLPPLTNAQAMTAFNDPFVAGMTFWQDASNSSGASFGAGSNSASNGLAYLPSAVVTLSGQGSLPFGLLYCAGLVLVGGSNVTLAG